MLRKVSNFLIAALVVLSFSAVLAQNAPDAQPEQKPAAKSSDSVAPTSTQLNPREEYSEADRPEENYLAKFHSLERVQVLMKYNLEQIYTLNVITTNFKKDHPEWESDYNKIYDGYKKAMDLYYRRNIIYSRVKLEENRKHINEFYKKVSDIYRDDTLEMLNRCASAILELDLQASTSLNPNASRKLFNQKMRLRVAYGQLDDAERARLDRFYGLSIFHYRVAKTYAIAILEDLDPEQYAAKKDAHSKYYIHKADNLNRIMNDKVVTKASEVVDKTDDTKKQNEENKGVDPELQ